MNDVIIYTDGACKGNPGPGGWGAVVVIGQEVVELGGRRENTTNNQMELLAAIEALKFARTQKAKDIAIYSDSSYVINGITKWVFGWKHNGWKTKEKKDVLNADLWQELDVLANGPSLSIKWVYVGGHVGIAGNCRVDEIASDFAEGKDVKLYRGALSGYSVDVLNLSVDSALHEKKTSSRSRSKSSAYSYVSEVGGEVRIHKTWAECEARVKGKPARFKKALSVEEEKQIVQDFSRKKS